MEVEKIIEENKGKIILFLIIGCVSLILIGIYNLGAQNICKQAGGELLINEFGKKRCVNITNLDLCISKENRIIDKPQNQYDLPQIIIGD